MSTACFLFSLPVLRQTPCRAQKKKTETRGASYSTQICTTKKEKKIPKPCAILFKRVQYALIGNCTRKSCGGPLVAAIIPQWPRKGGDGGGRAMYHADLHATNRRRRIPQLQQQSPKTSKRQPGRRPRNDATLVVLSSTLPCWNSIRLDGRLSTVRTIDCSKLLPSFDVFVSLPATSGSSYSCDFFRCPIPCTTTLFHATLSARPSQHGVKHNETTKKHTQTHTHSRTRDGLQAGGQTCDTERRRCIGSADAQQHAPLPKSKQSKQSKQSTQSKQLDRSRQLEQTTRACKAPNSPSAIQAATSRAQREREMPRSTLLPARAQPRTHT